MVLNKNKSSNVLEHTKIKNVFSYKIENDCLIPIDTFSQEVLDDILIDRLNKLLENYKEKSGALLYGEAIEDSNGRLYKAILFVDDPINLIIMEPFDVKKNFDEAMKELVTLKNSLQLILDSAYDGIFIIDDKLDVVWANKGYLRLTGYRLDELIGENVLDLGKRKMLNPVIAPKVIEASKSVTVTQTFKTKRTATVTGSPVYDERGKLKYIVSNVRDITELKYLREELSKTSALNDEYKKKLSLLQNKLNLEGSIIAKSDSMKKVILSAQQASLFDATVLINGKTGTGKEVIADIICSEGIRKNKPCIKVNCNAISPNLIESELFGYEPGAFTGASNKGKLGLFELANGGTIFLDEIGDLPMEQQVKLLRVLQEQEIYHVGGIKPIKIDVRIIAATNLNLEDLIKENKFREDLFYRLNVINIEIPPLEERKEDIVPLTLHYCEYSNRKYELNKFFNKDVLDIFESYDWPGNIRELKNLVERLVIMSSQDEIKVSDIPLSMGHKLGVANGVQITKIIPYQEAINEVEKQLIDKLKEKGLSTREMAECIGVSQSTIIRMLQRIK